MSTAYNIEQIMQNEIGWLFYNSALKSWKEIYNHLTGKRILDIGCAGGISMALIKAFNPTLEVFGFEGSDDSKDIWKLRNLNVSVGDIYSLPYEDHTFDTVYSSHVLEHLENPRKAVEESLRVTKKRVIHCVPSGDIEGKNFGTPHLHIFDRVNYMQLFSDYDVQIICYKVIEDYHINSLIIVLDI